MNIQNPNKVINEFKLILIKYLILLFVLLLYENRAWYSSECVPILFILKQENKSSKF